MSGVTDAEPPTTNWRSKELIAALLLGIAGVLTASAAYMSTLANGRSLQYYTDSARTTATANGDYNDGLVIQLGDTILFLEQQLLVLSGDEETADLIESAFFSPLLQDAYDAWDPDLEPTPLDVDLYEPEEFIRSERNFAIAEAQFDEARRENENGDRLSLATVFMAMALFFAGIATLFRAPKVQVGLLVASGLFIVPGLVAMGQGLGWL
jgi:hypothetical protein